MKNPNSANSPAFPSCPKPRVSIWLIILIIIAMFCFVAKCLQAKSPELFIQGRVFSKVKVGALNSEFEDFRYAGSGLEDCFYVQYPVDQPSHLGFGPLYVAHDYQLVVGKTGQVAAIAYGFIRDNDFIILPAPQAGTICFLMVLDGYTAPTAWQNRHLSSVTLHDLVVDGRYYETIFSLLLWPTDLSDDTYVVQFDTFWYWDGQTYVESQSHGAASPAPDLPLSQISTLMAPQGAISISVLLFML